VDEGQGRFGIQGGMEVELCLEYTGSLETRMIIFDS
jgi:hypothetical protein